MRERYVMRNGKLVPKAKAAPLNGAYVISDDLKADLEHMGYSDGRRTSSKSTFRRWTKEAGLVEKGNDRTYSERKLGSPTQDVVKDVAKSVEMLKNGYVPRLTQFED